ncbi:IS110 family RNA-guided transposase [Secundilactobacillus malefermentans]|uniref:IS110 family transposase n=1 Tax=Secundilactobacillus malefermentans TaxID=176292 RepID=UPI0011C76FC8|nr:IS110 family transposase [Secundilactobacillus malefermentans]QEA31010.1 IS110 family transposase [Secundilactobacillus malefermentans]
MMLDMEIIFGIDVSKHSSNVAILIDGRTFKEFKITNNRPGYKILDDALNSFRSPKVIFESSGIYSRSIRSFLQRENWNYTEINPLAAKKDMDGFRHNKNDRLDAVSLAMAMAQHHYQSTFKEKAVYGELHDLERTYQEFNEDIVRAKNRLHQKLQLTFPEVEQFISTTDGALYWHVVQQFPHASLVLAIELPALAQFILKATPKNMSEKRAFALARHLHDLASQSAPAVDYNAHAVHSVIYLANEVEHLSGLKADIIEEMTKISSLLAEIPILESIPGFGIKTAVCLLAELGDISRFHGSNAINAYVGIDLIQYQSGDFEMMQHIRKRGNPYARKILFKAVLNMMSVAKYHPSNISIFYQRKKQSSSESHTKKIAIAAMGRLIRTIYHLIKNNELYDSTQFSPEK